MKHVFQTLFISLLLPLCINAQNTRNAAILIERLNQDNSYVNELQNKLIERAERQTATQFYIYNWDNISDNKATFVKGKQKEESAVTQVHFISLKSADVNENPSLVIDTDTSGKTIRVYFPVRPTLTVFAKSIELKTSLILDYSSNSLETETSSPLMGMGMGNNSASMRNKTSGKNDVSIDFMKEFGQDPALMQRINGKEFSNSCYALRLYNRDDSLNLQKKLDKSI
jgi:hypothetical protein